MKKISIKTILASAAVVLMACTTACSSTEEAARQKDEARVRQETAMQMWQERCKKSGEKIYKTVDGVEGIFLIKVRPDRDLNYSDQFRLNDPYGSDVEGDGYIGRFLRGGSQDRDNRPPPAELNLSARGYKYVEAKNPADGITYRYTGQIKVIGHKNRSAPAIQDELKKNPSFDTANRAFVLEKTPIKNPTTRYGVTYIDISTPEDRNHWIAGSSLQVIDLHNNEVIAERIGYMIDLAQGSQAGNRSPWLFAADNACPPFAPTRGFTAQTGQTYRFTEQVLRPAQK